MHIGYSTISVALFPFRKMPMESFPSIFFYSLLIFSLFHFSIAAYTITPAQSIVDGQTLISSNQTFELGFFSPGDPKNRYLGIWYKKFPATAVWIANRQNPITDLYGTFTISKNGNLVLFDGSNSTIWASSNSSKVSENLIVQLLESGNLVLRDKSDENSENYLWQSFEFPCDTLLPGMKMGWNSGTGLNLYLTSWKNESDPSPGDFTFRIDNIGLPQSVLREKTEKKYRGGAWNGFEFSGTSFIPNSLLKYTLVYNTDDIYYSYEVNSKSVITIFRLNQSGSLQRLILNEGSSEWDVMFTLQNDPCDDYGQCGANGICSINKSPICECLKGFTPKSQKEWEVLNWSSGCVRRTQLDCRKGEGFVKVEGVKLPDLLEFWVNKNTSLKECEAECLKNCNCSAYANPDIRVGSSGCLIWFGNLIDIREFVRGNHNQVMYIRMPASELELMGNSGEKKKRIVIMTVVPTVSGMLLLSLVCWWHVIRDKRRKERDNETKEDIELPLFDLVTIATATNNFSSAHMIGEGGFGPVYKGEISMGQEIAVKRLSRNSGQGVEEFKNEVMLIAKLQHRNLVRLLGCCIEGEERMLIYEYMPNESLDYFIFDQNRSGLLAWQKRFDIVMGIARGLLYLHQDSRLRIVHRDLKTSNILLDSKLNPKISDFGIAKILGGDQIEAKTKRVVGTYGYMSPEYAIDGKFSAKSDVFSLGVLLLEIVSGKKNRGFHHPDHHHNLVGHAWVLWNEDKAMELMDPCLGNSYIESQVLRCIQVGLLCVQRRAEDRPEMSSVVFMLDNEGATRAQPKQPGFFIERSSIDIISSTVEERSHTENVVTITIPEAR